MIIFLFFKQKTAYEMRIRDGSSDLCPSVLEDPCPHSGGGLAMSDESILARVRRDATAAADERWRAHTGQLELLGREEAYQRGWQDAFGGAPSRLRWWLFGIACGALIMGVFG